MTDQWVRTGTPTGNGPPDPGNETAALGVGAQNGGCRESIWEGAFGHGTYRETAVASIEIGGTV